MPRADIEGTIVRLTARQKRVIVFVSHGNRVERRIDKFIVDLLILESLKERNDLGLLMTHRTSKILEVK